MDTARFLEIRPAPVVVFDRLDEWGARPRYQLATAEGGWRPVTFAEHATQVRCLAMYLVGRGHRPGQRGAIFAHNRVEWMAAALGLEAAGMVMVPIYPASTAAQASYVAQHSGATILFVAGPELLRRVFADWAAYRDVETIVMLDDTDPHRVLDDLDEHGDDAPTADDLEAKLVHWSQAIANGAEVDARDPEAFDRALSGIDLDQPAIMLYTSGTTGNPKGVALTHRNIGSNTSDWLQCVGSQIPADDATDVLWLPMSHIFGFGEACLGNLLGWTSYLAEPSTTLGLLPTVRPTIFMSVPAYWEKLAHKAMAAPDSASAQRELDAATGGRLRFCLSGGAGLALGVKELLHQCGVLVLEGYGLTECSPTLTINRPDAFAFDTVGKPMPSVELRLADDGEILARGPNVFSGYHRDEAATKAAFEDGWFKTGDIGKWTDDGYLRIVDRKKEILVTAGGKNVAPANIERHFATDPVFKHAVVYGDGKKFLVAGVWLDEAHLEHRLDEAGVPREGRAGASAEVVRRAVDAANARLARFEQIKRFVIMDRPLTIESGLLTSTLKIRRKKIYDAFRREYEGLYA